jgi:iron complex outermembrane receptor protein
LPAGNFLVQCTYLGYSTATKWISVKGNTTADFSMSTSAIEQNEVVVTGVSTATEIKRTPIPMQIISKQTLLETPSTNLIDAIAKQRVLLRYKPVLVFQNHRYEVSVTTGWWL